MLLLLAVAVITCQGVMVAVGSEWRFNAVSATKAIFTARTCVSAVPPPRPGDLHKVSPTLGVIDKSFAARLRYVPDQQLRLVDHNFRYWYLDQDGTQHRNRSDKVHRLEVSATETASDEAIYTALKIISRVVANMPTSVWKRLCENGAAGVFTMAEGTTIFPEYEMYRDRPECKDRCDHDCADTCLGDGRKYDTLAGLGGSRGTCVDDNILCNEDDPYRGDTNIMVHEFTHTVHGYGLSSKYQDQIDLAYLNAREKNIWKLGSYAMSTSYEYFAEASGVFFHANNYLSANGGMSNCFWKGYCKDQDDARNWLAVKDPDLFSMLSYTFTNYRSDLPGGLAQCVKL